VGSTGALVTIPVGASRMPLELEASSLGSAEETIAEVGSLTGSTEAVGESAADSVGDADAGGATSDVVGSTIVSGMPPVEPTAPKGSVLGVGSVDGGTMIVLSTTTVVTLPAEPELSTLVDSEFESPKMGENDVSVESGELLASKLVVKVLGLSVNVGLVVRLANRSLMLSVSRFVVLASSTDSNGVDWEEGESVVMELLKNCLFTWRGK